MTAAPQDGPDRQDGVLAAVLRWLRGAIVHNAALKFVALILAVTFFILVNTGKKDAVIGVTVGVSYSMPDDRVLVSDRIDQVRVTLKGSWRRIKRFDERELDRIHINLRGARDGEHTFAPDSLRLPSGLTLLTIEPASIPLRFERAAQKTVRVHVPAEGLPQRGYQVERVVARPSQIMVRGAASQIESLTSISTRQVDLSGRQASFTEALPLVLPEHAPSVQLMDTRSVEVEVILSQEVTTRRLQGVAVTLRHATQATAQSAERFAIEPAAIDIVLHGPQLVIEALGDELKAYVDVQPDDIVMRGSRQAVVHIADPPAGVGIEIVPHVVTLKLQKAD